MPRETKDQKISRLQEMLDNYQKYIEQVNKRNAELVQAEEDTFLHSPTYLQMKAELDFVKNLNKLNEHHLASVNGRFLDLQGKVEQQELTIADRDNEIHRLQMLLAEKAMEKQPLEQSVAENHASSERESVLGKLQEAKENAAARSDEPDMRNEAKREHMVQSKREK